MEAETCKADDLRKEAIRYMRANRDYYEAFGIDGINADLPPGLVFSSLSKRILEMTNNGSYIGEFEIDATAKSAHCTIVICADSFKRSYGSGVQKYVLKYTQMGVASGHYDCLIEE